MIFVLGYSYLVKMFNPPQPQNQVAQNPPGEIDEAVPQAKVAEGEPADKANSEKGEPEEQKPATDKPEAKFVKHPHEEISLGTDDETTDSGYYIQVNLSTTGAVIESVLMNDERYKDLKDTTKPLKLVGNNSTHDRTFSMSVKKIDDQLLQYNTNLRDVDWKVVKKNDDNGIVNEVVFRYTAPDQTIRVEKRYALKKVEASDSGSQENRDSQNSGYLLDVTFKVYNLGTEKNKIQYIAAGPTGIILENAKYTSKYRDFKYKFIPAEGSVKESYMYAKAISEAGANQEPLTNPFDYLSVDVQYFTTVLFSKDSRPFNERVAKPWIKTTTPVLISRNSTNENKSDISFQVTSREMELDPGSSESHHFSLYLGPKRAALLDPLGASGVLEISSWIGWLSKPMVWILNTLNHYLGFPYWLAIITLTILVRASMHPITRKQAASAKRMKELQPQLQELKKKYGNDREKMGQAQMQLFRDNNYNPLAGCLPLLLQMPIFIALFQGLRSSIDLRLAHFLWIENLAAPDMLFPLGFNIPIVNISDFNLLPILTVCLFLLQNKIFMPKPDPNDEQAVMQHKMMTYMMIFMGVMFYSVPAGLCVYFITSSLWGMGERKLLDFQKDAEPAASAVTADGKTIKTTVVKPGEDAAPKKKGRLAGMWEKAVEAAEAQQQLQREQQKKSGKNKKKGR